jgi:hypothetical protein
MKINFFRCNIDADVDDAVYAADPLLAWKNTPHGEWVMANAHNLTWHQQSDALRWGTDVVVRGEINDPRKITEYFLRWPDKR